MDRLDGSLGETGQLFEPYTLSFPFGHRAAPMRWATHTPFYDKMADNAKGGPLPPKETAPPSTREYTMTRDIVYATFVEMDVRPERRFPTTKRG